MPPLLPICFLSLAFPAIASAQSHGSGQISRRVEKAASQLQWLSIETALFDSRPWGPDAQRVTAVLAELTDGEWTPAQIVTLLRSPNPRVRTLGIVLLFRLDRTDVLPDIAAMADDGAATFPRPVDLANSLPPGRWPMEKLKVRDYARAVLSDYARESPLLQPPKFDLESATGKELVERFKAFSAARDPRLSTAGLVVAMHRATTMTTPVPGERERFVYGVLDRIDSVPMPRRFFVALKLEINRFYKSEERPDRLLELARLVPRDARLAAIRQSTPIDDPDLRPGFGADYFLDHALDLLKTSDADELLEIESKQRKDSVSPQSPHGASDYHYLVAASMLRPDRTDEILIPAISRLTDPFYEPDRMELAMASVKYGSEKGFRAGIDAFFNEKPVPAAYGFGRERFLKRLSNEDPALRRRTVTAIIRDPRLTTLGPASTRLLIMTAEGYLGRRLASDEEMENSRSIDESQNGARFQALADWHMRLKETLGEWSP